jgi:hypothetical protein
MEGRREWNGEKVEKWESETVKEGRQEKPYKVESAGWKVQRWEEPLHRLKAYATG